jgi:hypothetical protein
MPCSVFSALYVSSASVAFFLKVSAVFFPSTNSICPPLTTTLQPFSAAIFISSCPAGVAAHLPTAVAIGAKPQTIGAAGAAYMPAAVQTYTAVMSLFPKVARPSTATAAITLHDSLIETFPFPYNVQVRSSRSAKRGGNQQAQLVGSLSTAKLEVMVRAPIRAFSVCRLAPRNSHTPNSN